MRDGIDPRLARRGVLSDAAARSSSIADGDGRESPVCSRLLHEIFEAQADRRPDAVAVAWGDERVTYLELEQRANRLARHLRAQEVRTGSRVGILLARSPEAYVALLAVVKAGAAYVPIDTEYPDDRVDDILADSGAEALVTTAARARRHARFAGRIIRVDADREAIAAGSAGRLEPAGVPARPHDLCYVIYTSGSTGRPKGVMVEHRNAVHLVEAEARLFGVRPEDRVYQGFSLAFDASVEEIWLAFHAGATLIAATTAMSRAGPDLTEHMTRARVTVLSCVPTLLATLTGDVPTVRLLILGGEACPEPLVERWARPGRRIVNTYGPTETTVIATYADLAPGRPITIGRAVPGYRLYLLDERLDPVPRGTIGEICIGGAGVSRGYVGRPEETGVRFVRDPFAPANGRTPRMYRTGDLGRWNGEGEIEFLGRADSQVKLRGFRIELAEIESALMAEEGVRAAACALREDAPGMPRLVAYVVPRDPGPLDERRLRTRLAARLPAFMVPAAIETLEELPRAASGKLDRAALPPPRPARPQADPPRPLTETERGIASVWEDLFRPRCVSADDHFFLDLGGHSLLAARMVSLLRRDPRFATASVIDVYDHPTIARLARWYDARRPPAEQSGPEGRRPGEGVPGGGGASARHARAGALQAGGLYLVFGSRALQWVTPYLVYFLLRAGGHSLLEAVAWAAASAIASGPLLVLVAAAAKWTLLGRIQPGRHPLWGSYHLRWWLARNLVMALPLEPLHGTPLLPLVYRMFGARIGRDVHLGTAHLAAFDLISVGDGSSIDDGAWLLGATVERGELVVGPVEVGRGCFVGTSAVLREGSRMEDGARLEDLSLLGPGGRIPRGQTWAGSPARPVGFTTPDVPPVARPRPSPAGTAALYALLASALTLVPLAAFVPGIVLLTRIDPLAQPLLYMAATPLVGASFVLLLTAAIAALKWALVGRVRAGTHAVHGSFYVRSWIVDRLLRMSLDVLGSLHATLYLAPWYRALGARVGRSVELSTVTSAIPDLLELGDESTIADEVSLGAPRVERGLMQMAPTRVGRRAFVGNGGVVPQGTVLGEGSLVGVLSIAPSGLGAARPGATWLGSPPVLLPRRQPSTSFCESQTFRPSRGRKLARGAIEILRVTLPPAGFILVTTLVVRATLEVWRDAGLTLALLAVPVLYAAACAAVALAMVIAKWGIMGRYRPSEHPLWSPFVWRLELVNGLYEFLVSPLALEPLQGTPLLPWFQRLLGARIGRRTYLHTTGFLEWDLVEIGDEVAVNEDCVLQTHLFEDRILKVSRLHIGHGCTLGTASVVLYDSTMEDGAQLDALSLLMKGESLPARTAWTGIPARAAGAAGLAPARGAPDDVMRGAAGGEGNGHVGKPAA